MNEGGRKVFHLAGSKGELARSRAWTLSFVRVVASVIRPHLSSDVTTMTSCRCRAPCFLSLGDKMVQEKWIYGGGVISLREKGEMFDQKTGKKNSWDKALKITHEGKSLAINRACLDCLVQVLEDPLVQDWLKTL